MFEFKRKKNLLWNCIPRSVHLSFVIVHDKCRERCMVSIQVMVDLFLFYVCISDLTRPTKPRHMTIFVVSFWQTPVVIVSTNGTILSMVQKHLSRCCQASLVNYTSLLLIGCSMITPVWYWVPYSSWSKLIHQFHYQCVLKAINLLWLVKVERLPANVCLTSIRPWSGCMRLFHVTNHYLLTLTDDQFALYYWQSSWMCVIMSSFYLPTRIVE